jgi:hypothetical protein
MVRRSRLVASALLLLVALANRVEAQSKKSIQGSYLVGSASVLPAAAHRPWSTCGARRAAG